MHAFSQLAACISALVWLLLDFLDHNLKPMVGQSAYEDDFITFFRLYVGKTKISYICVYVCLYVCMFVHLVCISHLLSVVCLQALPLILKLSLFLHIFFYRYLLSNGFQVHARLVIICSLQLIS